MNLFKIKSFKTLNSRNIHLLKSLIVKYPSFTYLIIFTPLFFLNIRSDHDWGGDFAQYIEQAKCFIQMKSMNNIGYIYNEYFPSLSPRVYPPFFSILISPIYLFYQLNMVPYNYLISFFLVVFGILIIHFLKNYFGFFKSILIGILFIYNPFFLIFKSEILADIPFSVFFLMIIILFNTKKQEFKHWFLIGCLIGILCTIKSIGIVIFISLILHSINIGFLDFKHHLNFKTTLNKIGPIYKSIFTGCIVILFINLIAFHEIKISSGYEKTFQSVESIYLTFNENVFYYSELIKNFFNNYEGSELWITNLLGSGILILFIVGLLNSFTKESNLLNWITIVYFITLFVYPYKNSGFRFLIPVIPLILFYISKSIRLISTNKINLIVFYFTVFFTLSQYRKQLITIQQSTKIIQEGPYKNEVNYAFKEINRITTRNSVIVFKKPSVLSLYTNRKSFCNSQNSTVEDLETQFTIHKPTHFLIYEKLIDTSLVNYLEQKKLQIIWKHKEFSLYKG
jgi:hypothetical protein